MSNDGIEAEQHFVREQFEREGEDRRAEARLALHIPAVRRNRRNFGEQDAKEEGTGLLKKIMIWFLLKKKLFEIL